MSKQGTVRLGLRDLMRPDLGSGIIPRDTVIDATSASAANINDVLTLGVRQGFDTKNLVMSIIYLTFVRGTPILDKVLPQVMGTTTDMVRTWSEMVFDATKPHQVGERGRSPIINYRFITRKITTQRYGIGWDVSDTGAEQAVLNANDGGKSLREMLLGHTVSLMTGRFEMTALNELVNADLDPDRGVLRGQDKRNTTIEQYFENRNKIFAIFDKAHSRRLAVMPELSIHISDQLRIVKGEVVNTVVCSENLAKKLVGDPSVSEYYKAGPVGPIRLKTTADLLSADIFAPLTAEQDDGKRIVVPIKDSTAFVNQFGSSLMTRPTAIGYYYPFMNRPQNWGTEQWKKSWEDIEVYDAYLKRDTRLNLIDAVMACGRFGDDGKPAQIVFTEKMKQFEDQNGQRLDMFQDKDGDVFEVFGQWSQAHFGFAHLKKWVKQVILQLNESFDTKEFDRGLRDAVTDVPKFLTAMNFIEPLFKDALSRVAYIAPGDDDATLDNFKDFFISKRAFLVRRSTAARRNDDRRARFETVLNHYKDVFQGVPTDNIILTTITSGLTVNDRKDLAQLFAIEKFDPFKIPLAANMAAEVQTRLAKIPDSSRDLVKTLSQTYEELLATVVAEVQQIFDAAGAGADVVAQKAALDAVYSERTYATSGLAFVAWDVLVRKLGAWDTTPTQPMSLSDPDRPMSPDELRALVERHGAVFAPAPGSGVNRGVQSKFASLSHYDIAEHFSLMKNNADYRDSFMNKTKKLDYSLKSFFTDSDLIEASVGDKWKNRNYVPQRSAPVDEVAFLANILRAVDSHFTDNWNTVTSQLFGLEQVIAKLFLLSPINSDTIWNWHHNEIPLPFGGAAIMDQMIYEAEQMVICARGIKDLGYYLICETRLTNAHDGLTQKQGGVLTTISGVRFTNKRNIVVLRDVKLNKALGGCGTKVISPEHRLSGEITMDEGITYHVMPVGTNLPIGWTTAGFMENDFTYRGIDFSREPTVPCIGRLWHDMALEEILRQAEVEEAGINTIVWHGRVMITEDGVSFNKEIHGAGPLGHLNGPWDANYVQTVPKTY